MESTVLCGNFHNGQRQGQGPGPNVSYCASLIPCTGEFRRERSVTSPRIKNSAAQHVLSFLNIFSLCPITSVTHRSNSNLLPEPPASVLAVGERFMCRIKVFN